MISVQASQMQHLLYDPKQLLTVRLSLGSSSSAAVAFCFSFNHKEAHCQWNPRTDWKVQQDPNQNQKNLIYPDGKCVWNRAPVNLEEIKSIYTVQI